MSNRTNPIWCALVVGLMSVGCGAAETAGCGNDVNCGAAKDAEEENVGESQEPLWLAAVSEETGPAYCPYNTVTTGVSCSGAYCDNVSLNCESVANASSSYSWTDWFSEEGTYYQICSAGFVTGLQCSGGWCNDMRLECMNVWGSPRWPCNWSGWFSEENPPLMAPPGYAVAGMACSGWWCDNINLYYCKL